MAYFDDDGTEVNPDLYPKPTLCLSCKKDEIEDDEEEILCNLNRLGQRENSEFKCYSYENKYINLSELK
jgi:hypothetical protein